ncbi:MFS transporter [Aaosphaeria arxii CBS 175.79]|uniref:MFS transporter n=1 Tax=Aaosphaeria arxii CBS 175.79 TaxID=1450172 RepID=A0A6A5XL71_9PLEO|nr:MFS transporter [Aaosphaeria arxii CBS 175.79]KAF2013611.1 MFS transporter [Aaosphaeria arxii CBS 175.79]
MEELKQTTTVDTLHQDEAMRVLAQYTGDRNWEQEEEKKLVRKIDWKLLPLLCTTYGLQYYDKAMLSQAALFGLRTDLNLNGGNRYSFSAAIFYLGFIVGSYPAILMAQRWPIERVAAGIIAVWGVCLMCSAACTNWQTFYVQRFFLGFLESGISPMFMLVVGGWYKKPEQALRMGAWYCCTGYVSAVSPLINYGLGHIRGGSLNSWQYMYLFAGALTILWGLVILFFMPPDPIRAKGFSDREHYIAVARMRENNSGVRNTHFKVEQLWEALLDLRFWLIFAIAFLMMIANGPVSSFIPIIISGFGFNPLNSLLLTLPAGVVIGSIELGAAYVAYKIPRIRAWTIAICQIGTILASILLWQLPRSQKGGLLFACYILASFGGGYAVLMGLHIANTAGYTKRSVTSSGIFVGYCLGNFVGPLLFKPEDAPVYAPGFVAVLITAIVAAALSVVYRFFCVWENRRRDKSGTTEAFDNAYDDDLTDMKNPQFRYTL